MATLTRSRQSIIDSQTIVDAIEWQEHLGSQWIFCTDKLEVGNEEHAVEAWVDRLEERYEKLIEDAKLPNGAIEVARLIGRDSYVAAFCGGVHPWVTWGVNPMNNCYWGHYCETMEEAMADLKERAK